MIKNEESTIFERDGQIYIDKICCGTSKTHIIEECGKIQFVKRVDETGRITAIFFAQTEFFAYWYNTVHRSRLKVTLLEQEEGYYYELEECAGFPFAKKIDTNNKVKDIYSWKKVRLNEGINNQNEGYWYILERFGQIKGYCYKLEECAGLPFAKTIDETTNKIQEICMAFGEWCAGRSGKVCNTLLGTNKVSFELKEIVNRPYIICEYQNKTEVYLLKDVLQEPQAKRIEIGDWIGKFEELDLEEICRNDTTYFYDKKSKTLCDADGVIIISGCN